MKRLVYNLGSITSPIQVTCMYTNTWLEFMLHITIYHDKENETCAGIKCKCQHPECSCL